MAVVKQNTYNPGVNNDVTNVCVNVDLNRIGTDLSFVEWSGSQFVLKAGSLVENSGSLYSVTADINLGNVSGNLIFNATTSTFSLSTTVATYDPAKGGYYTASTTRRLKWRTIFGGYLGIRENLIGVSAQPTLDTGIAIGDQNSSSGDGGIAIGTKNNATATRSLATGYANVASHELASAVGSLNLAININASAIGSGNTANGQESSAVGRGNSSSGSQSTAIGEGNASSGQLSCAIGVENTAGGLYASAFGSKNTASADASSAIGKSNIASADNSSAFGIGCVSQGISSSAIGNSVNSKTIKETVVGNTNSNIRIFDKSATEDQVFDALVALYSPSVAFSMPALYFKSVTAGGYTFNITVNCSIYKTTPAFILIDESGTILKTISNAVGTSIGTGFAILDIAR